MNNERVEVVTTHESDREHEIAETVREIINFYNIPLFTKKIKIEPKVIPHSHPVLTLNTRTNDPIDILQTLVHEQFHWFADEHPKYSEAIDFFKRKI